MQETMKASLRVPTLKQYAYIELQVEGTSTEIINRYLAFIAEYEAKQVAWNQDKPPF